MLYTQTILWTLLAAGLVSSAHFGQDSALRRHARAIAHSMPMIEKRAPVVYASSKRASCKRQGNGTVSSSITTASSAPKTTSKVDAPKTPAKAEQTTTKKAPTPDSGNEGGNSGGGGGHTVQSPSGLTPNGKKAGIAGGDSYQWMKDHIGWWYDWTPSPDKGSNNPIGVPMLWGGGTSGADNDYARLQEFRGIDTPKYVLGFEEPDCAAGGGSAGMPVSQGVRLWNELIAPLGRKGARLGSPSMCHQAAEKGWLGPFRDQIDGDWDFTNIHVNKNNRQGVLDDLDHYWNTYKKPLWVSEFACVDDQNGFTPCTDQDEINDYINMIVPLFEGDYRVAAYAYSDGRGLGNVWPTVRNGQLSASGRTYLNAISRFN